MSKVNELDEYEHFNELFLKSDSNSNNFQKKFIRARIIQIITLSTSTFVAIFAYGWTPWIFLGLTFISVIGALIIWWFKFDQKWYLWRSIAESIKSASWQYCMRGEKFRPEIQIYDAKSDFVDFTTKLILDHEKDKLNIISASFTRYDKNTTSTMDSVRNQPLKKRANIYINSRILNQKEWYVRKSNSAADSKTLFNILILVSYFLAALFVIFDLIELSVFHDYGTSIGSFWVTVGLALLGWIQIRNYANLETSYKYTAVEIEQLEIEFLREMDKPEFNDEKFSELVQNSEAAFSREHTSWRARKQQI